MKYPKCKKCGLDLAISEWDGWIWKCFICDEDYHKANDKEVEEWEKYKDIKNK